jgi:RimJ/RimL family protein N-acetyltransferase
MSSVHQRIGCNGLPIHHSKIMILQPTYLKNDQVELHPLREGDFEELYLVASDPLIWEQHPNPDRYKRDVFSTYFEGAIASGGAFLVREARSGRAIGSTRFYDLVPQQEVKIGYTFFSRDCWGRSVNPQVKKLMLDHAFRYVGQVIFHVGLHNMRSRIAMERLGAERIGEEEVAYFAEAPKVNVVYRIKKPMQIQ